MNKTLSDIINSREDLSNYLFHFTKRSKDYFTLLDIVNSQSLLDVNNNGVICFTEAPVSMLIPMFKIFERFDEPMYSPYGVAICKDILFDLGARPVIYGDVDELDLLDESIRWRFEPYEPGVKDFSWLREWRVPVSEIKLNKENCFLVVNKTEELSLLYDEDDVRDIDIDGCVADGQFWASVTGEIGRQFKGIALEELHDLRKKYIDKTLSGQSFDDTIPTSLGGFIS